MYLLWFGLVILLWFQFALFLHIDIVDTVSDNFCSFISVDLVCN